VQLSAKIISKYRKQTSLFPWTQARKRKKMVCLSRFILRTKPPSKTIAIATGFAAAAREVRNEKNREGVQKNL